MMGDKDGRWVITDNSPLMHRIGYSKIIMIPIEEDYDLSNSLLHHAFSENASKLYGKPVDIRTKHISVNNVNITAQFVAINMKTVTAGQLNAQKNEFMHGWRLKEPEHKKPWWRFW